MKIGTAFVGRTDGKPMEFFGFSLKKPMRFESEEEANDWLDAVMHVVDPNGLDNGDYYVDVVTEDSEA